MIVSEFMSPLPITCYEDQTVEEAAKVMVQEGFSAIPVVNRQKKLVGILTQSDFVGKEVTVPHALASIKQLFGQLYYFRDIEPIYNSAKKRKLSEVMSKNPTAVGPNSSLTDVVNIMNTRGFKRLPVVDGESVVGIVTRKNLLKAFLVVH